MTHFYDMRQWRESWRWGFPEPGRALDTDAKGYLVRRHLMMWSSVLWLPVRFHEYSVGLVLGAGTSTSLVWIIVNVGDQWRVWLQSIKSIINY